jgi:hypothetical protein
VQRPRATVVIGGIISFEHADAAGSAGALRSVQTGKIWREPRIEITCARGSNLMRYALLLIAIMLFAVPASAEEYEKAPNGGLLLEVAGIDAELMTAGNTVTINVFVPNTARPVPSDDFTAAALIVSDSNRERISLTPQGENSLRGDAKAPVARGATVTLTIRTAEGKSGQVIFKK